MAETVVTDVVTCYDGVFKGMYDGELDKLFKEGRRLLASDKWKDGKDIFVRALDLSVENPQDKKTLEFVISELNRRENYEIKSDVQPSTDINWHFITDRDMERLDESFFSSPQSVFFLNIGIPGTTEAIRLVGRRILSDWWVTSKIAEMHCSFITANMILGVFIDQRLSDSNITVYYYPLTNPEKLKVMEDIKANNGKDTEIIFPFPLLQESTHQERCTPPEGWMVDEGFAALLGSGEERLRAYSTQFLKEAGYDKPLLFDPACSTGQFLSTLKNVIPGSYTIGQDLSQQMADLAKKKLDEAHCANAATPKIKQGTADAVIIRFLNSKVVKTADAEQLLHALVSTVKLGGYVIVFGMTPVLLSSSNFRSLKDFSLRQCIGVDHSDGGIFQYYVLKKFQ